MHYYFGSPNLINFEAQLFADGRVQFITRTWSAACSTTTVPAPQSASRAPVPQDPTGCCWRSTTAPTFVGSQPEPRSFPRRRRRRITIRSPASAGDVVSLGCERRGRDLDLRKRQRNGLGHQHYRRDQRRRPAIINFTIASAGTLLRPRRRASLAVQPGGLERTPPSTGAERLVRLRPRRWPATKASSARSPRHRLPSLAITRPSRTSARPAPRPCRGTDDSTFSTGIGFSSRSREQLHDVASAPNGLITFGGTDGTFSNADLTTSPSLAGIAPLWDASSASPPVRAGSTTDAGSGQPAHRHPVEPDALLLRLAPGDYFEAQLYATGASSSTTEPGRRRRHDNGASATVGIKDAGTQGANRLLLAFNNGPNAFVAPTRAR